MKSRFAGVDSATTWAMVGAAAIGAQYIAGKAARDALFLAYFEPDVLPRMIIGTSVFSILLVVGSSKLLRKVAPGVYVPIAFAACGALLLGIWGISGSFPRVAAPLLYLLISGIGPMLGSGFWLIASERFDPRTAKQRFGQIGSAGTVGGLVGGLVAARIATAAGIDAIIPLLAALNALCAWQTRLWARTPPSHGPRRQVPAAAAARSGMRILADTRYLRHLALLVLLGTMAAAFLDYAFKVQVKTDFGPGPRLGSFFAFYYTALSLVSFVLQAFASRAVLEKLGLAAAMGAPSMAVMAGGAATLFGPVLPALIATRGGEAAFRGSLLRSAYEVFYTPISPEDKRAVKGVIDVGVDRTGDILGAGVIQILLWMAVGRQLGTLLGLAVVCSSAALMLAHRLSRGYVTALEQSLLNRAVELDIEDAQDWQTRTVLLKTLQHRTASRSVSGQPKPDAAASVTTELEVQDIRALRSRDPDTVRRVLLGATPPAPVLIPHVIRLLEWDPVANEAVQALRAVADDRAGELVDALIDPNQPFAVRRRLARVFSASASQRAADGLILGLEDLRFEVRFQCGRSLAAISARNPRVRVDPARVSAIVQREVGVSRQVWESRRLIDSVLRDSEERPPLDNLIDERASRALAHVFTLLGLMLPTEPLRIAYRGLKTTDKSLRGTALEYLESVLPPEICKPLWPFLEGDRELRSAPRPTDEVLQELLRSNQSILLNLEQLRARQQSKGGPAITGGGAPASV